MQNYEELIGELFQNLYIIDEIITEQRTTLWSFAEWSSVSEEKKIIKKCARRLEKINALKDELIEIVQISSDNI